jgi:hypothetical protein
VGGAAPTDKPGNANEMRLDAIGLKMKPYMVAGFILKFPPCAITQPLERVEP